MQSANSRPARSGHANKFIEHFEIVDLHGTQNVVLELSSPFGVFIADNGSGKTTALYLLQCLLRKDFTRMLRFSFTEIRFRFHGGEMKSLLSSSLRRASRGGIYRLLGRRLRSERVIDIPRLAELARLPFELARNDPYFRMLSHELDVPTRFLHSRLTEDPEGTDLFEAASPTSDLKKLAEYISEEFEHSVIYLPTYRRVEQDLKSIFDIETKIPESDQQHIHFGMSDVAARIANICEKIRTHFVAAYSQISGQMLSEFTKQTEITRPMKKSLADRALIQIVLSRVGKNISAEDRDAILKRADEGTLTENQYLSVFIFKLIQAYAIVRDFDTSVQDFANVCNGYLINKAFVYDSANVSLNMINKIGGKELSLDSLSSGEKQILGVMSEIYLGDQSTYGIVIDEPELSLSVEWQRKFLPDIMHSTKCGFLVAATHSPFIFENELDVHARPVRVFSK
jgi:predicted ATPase